MPKVLNLHKSQTPKMRPLSQKMKITETNAQLRSTIASRTLEIPKENSNKNAKRKNSSKKPNVLNLHKSQTQKMRPLSHKMKITETNAQLRSTIASTTLETPKEN